MPKVDGFGDHPADFGVCGRDGGHLGDLVLRIGVPGDAAERGHGRLDTGLDPLLERHRVGPGGHVAQALVDHGPGQHGGCRRPVSGDVVGLLGHLFDELGPDAFERVLELDVLGDGDAVVGDGGGAPLLVEDDVAAFGSEGDAYGVGELVINLAIWCSSVVVSTLHCRVLIANHACRLCATAGTTPDLPPVAVLSVPLLRPAVMARGCVSTARSGPVPPPTTGRPVNAVGGRSNAACRGRPPP
jgi:hypothetical protein